MEVRFPLGLLTGEPAVGRLQRMAAAQAVPCGQYQWPFALQLPPNLPPTLSCW